MSGLWRTLLGLSSDPSGASVTPSRLHAEALLEEARQELDRADGKAAILLSAAGVIVGALIAGSIAGDWHPGDLDSTAAELIAWAAIVVASSGVLLLALAVKPKTGHTGDREQLAFFGHVVQYLEDGDRKSKARRFDAARKELAKDLSSAGADSMERLADQLLNVSLIVHRKYRLVQRSFWAFGGATLMAVVALAVEAWQG